MKVFMGMEVELYAFRPSVLDGGEWSVPFSGNFTAGKIAPTPAL
jgi:hypothetical protein